MNTTITRALIYFFIFCLLLFLIYRSEREPNKFNGKWVRVRGRISSVEKIKDEGFLYRIGDFYFKNEAALSLEKGEMVETVGKVEARVIGGEWSQLWLVNQSITRVSSDSKSEEWFFLPVSRFLQQFRQKIINFFVKALPEPQGSLFLGIVWGIKMKFQPNFYEALKKAGLVHLVVASGQNLSIFSKVLLDWFSLIFKRKRALILTFFVILLYVMLVGGEPPLVRAALMAALSFLGLYLGREVLGGVALFASALLMLFFDPELIKSISFQLSFAATFGLIFIAPKIKKFRIFKLPLIGENFLETTSAQIMTMPLLFYHFGIFNPLSLVSNLLVLWMIPLLMSLGMSAFFLGLAFPLGGRFLLLLCWPLLSFFIKIAEIFG